MADKRAQREAAERIERGIECYGAGDLPAAERELEAALALDPESARARQHLGWVRELIAGRRRVEVRGQLDDDALQLVDDALPESDAPPTPTPVPTPTPIPTPPAPSPVRHVSSPSLDSPWAPVPLVTSHATPQTEPPREEPPRSIQTLLGVQPAAFDAPQLTPTRRAASLFPVDENTASKTREWRGTPTGTNLPLLDVPELTDQQVQELLALDGAPLTELEAPPVLEIEAEPTPLPHRNPLDSSAPLPRDATTPGVATLDMEPQLTPPGFELGKPFSAVEEFEQTPTRERRDVLRSVLAAAPDTDSGELKLLPLEVARDPQQAEELEEGGGTNPTTPFVRRKLAEYVSPQPPPKLEELPLPPGAHASSRDTRETPALEPLESVQNALDRGDPDGALDAAEAFVAEAGGLDAEACRPQLWLLEQAYQAAIGSLERVVAHGRATPDLDPRSAFLLSRLDGMSSAEDLLDVSGMPRIEALRLLALLLRRGVVTLR